VIEQPEGLIGFAAAKMASESDQQEKPTEEKRRAEPDIPVEANEDRNEQDPHHPQPNASRKGAFLAIYIEVDRHHPQEGIGKSPKEAAFHLTDVVVSELVGCEQHGDGHRQRKARNRGTHIGKSASPPQFARHVGHHEPPCFGRRPLPTASRQRR
jgi:hypothetical protein